MTQTIILSCPPNTPESDAALSYCLKQARQHPDITCVFFVGYGIAHAFEQCNNNVSEWKNLCAEHQIPLYCCAHSIDQLTAPGTPYDNSTQHTKEIQLKEPFQTAGLGVLVEACINSSTIISFPSRNMLYTPNGSIPHTVNTDAENTNTKTINNTDTTSLNTTVIKQKTRKSIVCHLHSHDIMCHVTMSALFNIALMLLVFEQKVTIHLQGNKSKTGREDSTQKIDANCWITHNASTLVSLKDMGINSITLDKHLTPQLATPLRSLDLRVMTPTDISTNIQTPTHDDENKNIYL